MYSSITTLALLKVWSQNYYQLLFSYWSKDLGIDLHKVVTAYKTQH